MKSFESEFMMITFSDLKRLCSRHWQQIRTAMIICAALAFCLALIKEPQYLAEASFKQANRSSEMMVNMKEVFQQFLSMPTEGSQSTVMCSNAILQDVVEELGMQALCDSRSPLSRIFSHVWENLRSELRLSLPNAHFFRFSHISYLEEKPLSLFLKLKDPEHYQILDHTQKVVAEGILHVPLILPDVKLTLEQAPKDARLGILYPLKLFPLHTALEKVRKKLEIRPLKIDKNILRLTYTSRDRFLAAELLNKVMQSYLTYLKLDNEEVCKDQLAYLDTRQEELLHRFDQSLTEHVDYLKKNLSADGYIGFSQEVESLAEPKTAFASKISQIDLELWRHKAMFKNPLITTRDKKREKTPLSSLAYQKVAQAEPSETNSAEKQQLLLSLQECDLDQSRAEANLLLSLPHEENPFSDLSLTSAQELFNQYTQQRDLLQREMKELSFLQEKLEKPDIELSSLGAIFNDRITDEFLHKASAIALQLKDNENRSEKEQERLKAALETQRNFLAQHIQQTIELKKLKYHLLDEKIASLQETIVNLLESEKGLLSEKLHELNGKMVDLPEKWRQESLLMMKKEINGLILEGVSQLAETKYISQHLYYTGSKPLDLAAIPVKERPSRLFFSALLAAFLGGFAFYFLMLCRGILKGLPVSEMNLKLSGYPFSGTLSKTAQADLKTISDTDLETLRYVAEFILSQPRKEQALITLCIGGSYPNYSFPLAELLSLRGLKTLVIGWSLSEQSLQSTPGLYHYLLHPDTPLPITHHAGFDHLPSGTTPRHAVELVHTPLFSNLLTELKQKYDLILFFTDANAAKAEGLSLLRIADAAIITAQQEKKEELRPYCTWAQQKADACATFLFAQE